MIMPIKIVKSNLVYLLRTASMITIGALATFLNVDSFLTSAKPTFELEKQQSTE